MRVHPSPHTHTHGVTPNACQSLPPREACGCAALEFLRWRNNYQPLMSIRVAFYPPSLNENCRHFPGCRLEGPRQAVMKVCGAAPRGHDDKTFARVFPLSAGTAAPLARRSSPRTKVAVKKTFYQESQSSYLIIFYIRASGVDVPRSGVATRLSISSVIIGREAIINNCRLRQPIRRRY